MDEHVIHIYTKSYSAVMKDEIISRKTDGTADHYVRQNMTHVHKEKHYIFILFHKGNLDVNSYII